MEFTLRQVVEVMAPRLPRFQTMRGAKDNCALASILVHDFLQHVGFSPRIWSTYYDGEYGHYFVVVSEHIIDFTFRQFEPESGFPLFVETSEAPPKFRHKRPITVEEHESLRLDVKASFHYPAMLCGMMGN